MDTVRLRPRIAAPTHWLAAQPHPALDRRRRLVETCRAELVWARADWLEAAGTAEGWPEACLPHEQAAARLVELWGHLHPLEDRLRQGLARLRARRRAGWPWQSTLADVQRHRRARRGLWRAFLAAARDYRDLRCADSETATKAGRAHSLQLESAERNVPGETGITLARISGQMEPRAVSSARKSL